MGISPWLKTSVPTAPTWQVLLVPDSGTFNVSGLTTGNFSMLFKNLDTGAETNGLGTFNNLVAASVNSFGVQVPASIQYQVASAEVIIGRYQPIVLVTLSSGVQPFILEETWEVVSL